MDCDNVEACITEIGNYERGRALGRALLVNSEDYQSYQEVRKALEADQSMNCVCAFNSDLCIADGFPDFDDALKTVSGDGNWALTGLSQVAFLRSAESVDELIGKILGLSFKGHVVVLLNHCEQFLQKHFRDHIDVKKRVILIKNGISPKPKIRLLNASQTGLGPDPLNGMRTLFDYLEQLDYGENGEAPEVVVKTRFPLRIFTRAMYSVTECDGVYEMLAQNYQDVRLNTVKSYGTDDQWAYLAGLLDKYKSIAAIAKDKFGRDSSLGLCISKVTTEKNSLKLWLLWLCMKIIESNGSSYLSKVLSKSQTVSDFTDCAYMTLLEIPYNDSNFVQYYVERKALIAELPSNITKAQQYCNQVGALQQNGIYYLTDNTDFEKRDFFELLKKYDYSEDKILEITKIAYPEIYKYLQKFKFNEFNTTIPNSVPQMWDALTDYFNMYKWQKVTSKISPKFMDTVNRYAVERPYNKLPSRDKLVYRANKKEATLYFFDALGVEYLAYIQSLCEKYGLIADISVARCELPSITSQNKGFVQYFNNEYNDIKDLDDLKHHNKMVDYQKCKVPVHLFDELKVLDEKFHEIRAQLDLSGSDHAKAFVVADHGASRLAVISEQVADLINLDDEKGEHGGRCCKAPQNPTENYDYITYANDYAILANYKRFKGGRKADVEVHGGGTLEEVLVPVIIITRKPVGAVIKLTNDTITLKAGVPAKVEIYSTILMNKPVLLVHDKQDLIYEGRVSEDHKYATFEMPDQKRTKDLTADLYDDKKLLRAGLAFKVQKGTKEIGLFKKKPF